MIRRLACVSGILALGLAGCTAIRRPECEDVRSQAEAACREAAVVFHVSVAGNDANPGLAEAPFASLGRAQLAVRELKETQGRLPGPVTVLIHEGVYRLSRPLVFTPEDSGSVDSPITYQAAPGEEVVISGGRTVSGWRKHDDKLWVADVPWAGERDEPFVQLFVNGCRRPRARTPNAGSYFYSKRLRLDKKTCKGMTYVDGDLKPWPGFETNGRIVLFHNWVNSVNSVGEADWDRHRIRFHRPAGAFFLGPSIRYYVENVFAALDAPGEWFLDHEGGKLHYFPVAGERPDRADIVAPVVDRTLLSIEGDAQLGVYVEHLAFRGLSFQHTDADLSRDYRHSVQGAHYQRGAIFATGLRNSLIEGCEFTRLGEHAVSLREGCADNVIRQCHMHNLGGGGVYLSESALRKHEDNRMTVRTTVENNVIHDGGYIFAAACGVFLGGSASYNHILHNEICDLSWMGVHLGWSWNGKSPTQTHHNEVGYNHIHHLGNGVLCDIGGIYTLGVSPGTVLHHNLIHDITRFERGKQGYGGWGIYLDAGSSEIRVENNVVYNTRDGGFHAHCDNWPHDDVLVNNVFAYSQDAQMKRNNIDDPEGSHLHIERNIIYNRGPKMYGGSNWKKEGKFTCARNCYWSEDETELVFGGRSLEEWQEEGRDTDSVVADPLFVNPGKGDFRLKPGSPAFALGFKPIDIDKAGVFGSKAWCRLPTTITHRTVEVAPPLPENWPIRFDFEDYDAGDKPDGGIAPEGGASVVVTDERAASGKQCMHFVDAPNVTDWKPHWCKDFAPRSGVLRMRCCVRNDPSAPATITLEFRDWPRGKPFATGPHLRLTPEGNVQVPDGDDWTSIGSCPVGEWVEVTVELTQKPDMAGTWTVSLTGPSGLLVKRSGLACRSDGFRSANWFGVVGADTKAAVFQVDNVRLE